MMRIFYRITKKLLFFFTLTLMCFFPYTTHAEEENNINKLALTNYNIIINLTEAGNLKIQEDLNYYLQGHFNGVFKNISVSKTKGLSDITVSTVKNGMDFYLPYVENVSNGNNDVFGIIKEKNNIYKIKIYSPSNNENKSFKLNYTLYSVATSYGDVGELYYNIWDTGYDTTIQNMTITLNLPKSTDSSKIKAFFHGDINCETKILDNKTVVFKTKSVPKGNSISIRVLFPKELIPDSKNTSKDNVYNKILKEESKAVTGLSKTQRIFALIFIALDVLAIVFSLYNLIKNSIKRKVLLTNTSPKACTPAVLSKLLNREISGIDFISTLLDLSRKNYLYIYKFNKNCLNHEYAVKLFDKPTDNLLQHEKHFLKMLLNNSSSNVFKMSDLEYLSKDSSSKFIKDYNKWCSLIDAELVKNQYYYTNSENKIWKFILVFQSCFSLYILNDSKIVLLITVIYIFLIFPLRAIASSQLNDFGYSEKMKWLKIKSCFVEGKYNLISENSPLDEYFPYAISLRVSTFFLEEFREFILSNPNYGNNWLLTYFKFDDFADTNSFYKSYRFSKFTSDFSDITSDNDSSSGAGGGGTGGF